MVPVSWGALLNLTLLLLLLLLLLILLLLLLLSLLLKALLANECQKMNPGQKYDIWVNSIRVKVMSKLVPKYWYLCF